jgi:ribosomal protein S18 acetylase RimI-like enzyme
LNKVIKRESAINTLHRKNEVYHYLWFIGVDQQDQNRGIGSKLLNDIITESAALKIPIYFETSVAKNVTWYKKFGLFFIRNFISAMNYFA